MVGPLSSEKNGTTDCVVEVTQKHFNFTNVQIILISEFGVKIFR